jgi:RNA polymerase sigma factor (sigma-70 family)
MRTALSRHSNLRTLAQRLPAAIRRDLDLPKYFALSREDERTLAESIWSARESAWSVILSERLASARAAELLGLADMAGMLSPATAAHHDQDDDALREACGRLSVPAAKACRSALARADALVRRLEQHNVKLVLYVIGRWFADLCDPRTSPFEVGDLLGWGMLGVRTAALRFDPATGNKFSTMATFWIRAFIGRESMDARYRMRLPIGMQENIAAVRKAEAALEAERGIKDADDATVARLAGLSVETTHSAREAMRVNNGPSLSAAVRFDDSEEGCERAEATPDDRAPSEADLAEHMDLSRRQALLGAALSNLTERERFVVEARHGLGVWQGDAATLSDVGAVFGVSRERVRQMEAEAVDTIRRGLRRAILRKQVSGARIDLRA